MLFVFKTGAVAGADANTNVKACNLEDEVSSDDEVGISIENFERNVIFCVVYFGLTFRQ